MDVLDLTIPSKKRQRKNRRTTAGERAAQPSRQATSGRQLDTERLQALWRRCMERERAKVVSITFSVWTGVGRREQLTVLAHTPLSSLLSLIAASSSEFATASHLLFVKEDVILPETVSVAELRLARAKKAGGTPLYYFGVREDVRAWADATTTVDSAHAAKVVDAAWWQRHRRVHPYSRWTRLSAQSLCADPPPPSTSTTSSHLAKRQRT